ncbi:MAG: phosphoglycerate kinase, partial [Elusimicrobiota bacterium]
ELINKAREKKVNLVIPVDHTIVDSVDFANKKIPDGAVVKITADNGVPAGFMGVDVGPKTLALIAPLVLSAKTIVWNGPLGIFEIDQFSKGTVEIATLVAQATDKGAVSVVGGGDSVSAVKKAGVDKRISHISTGGGASLEFLEGKVLPGIAALNNK